MGAGDLSFIDRERIPAQARWVNGGFFLPRAGIEKTRCNESDAPYFRSLQTMAEIANKYPENVTGAFYVDDQCIDCDLCRETAPANFTRNDDGGHSYVYKQPESPDEEALCKEAMEGCPVEAIGSDGGD